MKAHALWLLMLTGMGQAAAPTVAASPAVVRLATASGAWEGRSLAHDQQTCWLLARDGVLQQVRLTNVTSYSLTGATFRPETVIEARDRMRNERRPGMEVVAKGRYVVCAPVGQAATYAALLDQVYASFRTHFSRRGFTLDEPEFPLVAIVFPTRQQFVEYARQDQTSVSAALTGYYHRLTNRIALFAETGATARSSSGNAAAAQFADAGTAQGEVDALIGSIEAGPRDTLIHEATHQLAFNMGLHSRTGETPRWVSEGLAMLFEEDSRRDDSGSRDPTTRVNRPRYLWFMNYRQNRRSVKSLTAFIDGEDLLRSAPLDFYSEAWALSFYLVETRPAEFAKYLKTIAARDPLSGYPPAERRADFCAAFGTDLTRLEGQYLLFLDRINLK